MNMNHRQTWCDRSPDDVRGHACERAHEYRIERARWEPHTMTINRDGSITEQAEGIRESDEPAWLCDACATELRATHVVVRQTVREIRRRRNGEWVVDRVTHDVWKRR